MKSTGLFAELKKHPWILALVIVFHLSLAVLLGLNLSAKKPDMPAAQQHKIINAVVVDAKKIDQQKTIKKPEVKKLEVKKPEVKKPERLKEKEVEKQKKIALKKQKLKEQELIKKKELEKKQLEKIALEKKALEKKQLQKKEQEKKDQLALKKKQEQDRVKKEKLAAEKKVAEEKAKKVAAQKAKAEAEKKRRLEEERKRRAEEKADFENALLEEERAEEAAAYAAKLQTLRQKYVLLIAQKVENNWLRPVTTTEEQSCDVIVTQTMTGEVMDVRLKSCTSDNAFQRSVERAVRKASPLPMPPNPDVFDREIYFTFKPH